MKAISFAWTTPALLAGRKTVTRREWNDRYARTFRAGEQVWALDKVYRAGGHRVAIIRLTRAPYKSSELPEEDWEGEGFEYLTATGGTLHGVTPGEMWADFAARPEPLWVVRFELLKVLA